MRAKLRDRSPIAGRSITARQTSCNGTVTVVQDGGGNGLIANFDVSVNGLTVTVDASVSSGSIVNYEWNFGDGATGSGITATHTYASAGDYTITLTVEDDTATTRSTAQNVTVGSAGNGDGGGIPQELLLAGGVLLIGAIAVSQY